MGEYSLGDAMKYFLRTSKLKGPMQAVQIQEVWGEIMGTTIAKYTDKIQIFNGTLFITTQVAALKQELLFQKEKIKERVNEALGEKVITEVVIK
jgi:predicted nucleic acid-binding Zn ribbon protein